MCHSLDPDPAHADRECREEPTRLAVRVQLHGAPNTCMVRLAGDLDAGARPVLERALAPVLSGPPPMHLVLDLSAVTSIDAEGLMLLERLRRRVRERGGSLTLSGCAPTARRALQATRLIHFLTGTRRGDHRADARSG